MNSTGMRIHLGLNFFRGFLTFFRRAVIWSGSDWLAGVELTNGSFCRNSGVDVLEPIESNKPAAEESKVKGEDPGWLPASGV